ncbi:MAG TPA: BolA family protein [Myxococcota bacterium]|nr:BolA family protein [Myxococcota bacterium]
MTDTVTREQVEERLRERLEPTALRVIDESHLHVGHGAPGSHFRVEVVSERFQGLSRVAAQRLVYDALGEWIGGAIHACAVSARAPT